MTPTWHRWLPDMVLLGGVVLALVVDWIALAVLKDRGQSDSVRNVVLARFRRPVRVVLILIAISVTEPAMKLVTGTHATVADLERLAAIATVGWLLGEGLGLLNDMARTRYAKAGPDDLLARKLQTRVDVVGKVLVVFIVILTEAAMLITNPDHYKMTKKRKQLEALVGRGMPLTDPSVLALSNDLDRLIVLYQASTDPTLTDPADCDQLLH